MVGSVFKHVLQDLQHERHPLASTVHDIMHHRAMLGVTYYSSGKCTSEGACNCTNCTSITCPSALVNRFNERAISVYTCLPWASLFFVGVIRSDSAARCLRVELSFVSLHNCL